MFSITPSELLTIGVIALIVFGPRRLPELARKAGALVAQVRGATDELRHELERDLGESTAPFREAASGLAATGKALAETVEGQLIWVDEEPETQDTE